MALCVICKCVPHAMVLCTSQQFYVGRIPRQLLYYQSTVGSVLAKSSVGIGKTTKPGPTTPHSYCNRVDIDIKSYTLIT